MQRGYKFYPPKTEVIAHTIPSKSARSNSPPQHFSHPTQWPMSSLRCAGILAILTSPCPKLRRIHGATGSRHNTRHTILIQGKWSVQGCSRHTTTDVTVLKWPKWVIPSKTPSHYESTHCQSLHQVHEVDHVLNYSLLSKQFLSRANCEKPITSPNSTVSKQLSRDYVLEGVINTSR